LIEIGEEIIWKISGNFQKNLLEKITRKSRKEILGKIVGKNLKRSRNFSQISKTLNKYFIWKFSVKKNVDGLETKSF
jgi:hypothetical protein